MSDADMEIINIIQRKAYRSRIIRKRNKIRKEVFINWGLLGIFGGLYISFCGILELEDELLPLPTWIIWSHTTVLIAS